MLKGGLKKEEMNVIYKLFLLPLLVLTLSLGLVLAVVPSGITPTSVKNETAPADTAGIHAAIAGNVTEIGIVGYTTTQSWQGFFGNVSGTIQLADANDKVMYNWSLANPEGEVYATVNISVNWAGTACFDVSVDGDNLETEYGIANTDVDGIDETFYLQDHDEFYVNNIQIAADTCNSTRIYGDTEAGVDQEFEEVILEGGSGEIIFTALLEEASVAGFDGKDYDFEMLVLEDGHGTDTATTPYYFYVELE